MTCDQRLFLGNAERADHCLPADHLLLVDPIPGFMHRGRDLSYRDQDRKEQDVETVKERR